VGLLEGGAFFMGLVRKREIETFITHTKVRPWKIHERMASGRELSPESASTLILDLSF
jgi:hypothetical protein